LVDSLISAILRIGRDVAGGASNIYVIEAALGCHQGQPALEVNTICCRTSIYPLDIETAIAVLGVGLFKPVYWTPGRPEAAVNWERQIDAEGTVVHAALREGSLELNLAPAISIFSQHHGKRLAASVYFEIAAKYAEKVSGTIVQRATVVGCKPSSSPQELILAEYPAMPMSFDRICPGFRAVLQEATEGIEIDDTIYGHPMHLHDHAHGGSADLDDGEDLRRPVSEQRLWQPEATAPAGHICPECGASFPTDAQLVEHIASVHRKYWRQAS
jgi:hypothetical protein